MPTVDELNAGFDALEPDLERIVRTFIPSFFQQQAMNQLHSEIGRATVVDGVRRVLIAAEGVRNKPAKASSPR